MISGGVSKSDIVAQNMANLLNMNVVRPKSVEATALGAAQLAAIYRGWLTKDDVRAMVQKHKVFVPNDQQQKYMDNYKIWLKAVVAPVTGWITCCEGDTSFWRRYNHV